MFRFSSQKVYFLLFFQKGVIHLVKKNIIELLEKEESHTKIKIYQLLLEHEKQILKPNNDNTPSILLYTTNNHVFFVYKDPNLNHAPFIYSDEQDILYLLTFLLKEGYTIYFDYTIKSPTLSQEFILNQINTAIKENDEKTFYFYSSMLHKGS